MELRRYLKWCGILSLLVNSLLPFLGGKANLWAQTDFGILEPPTQSRFFVDYASFRDSLSEKYIFEVYYKVHVDALTFVKHEDRFKASYEIELTVLDKRKKQVTATSFSEDYIVDDYKETLSPESFLTNQINLSLYSGEYKLKARLLDHNSTQRYTFEQNFSIPSRFDEKIMFSDIEFAEKIAEGEKRRAQFYKKGKEVIPSVTRAYGDKKPHFFVYYEIYSNFSDPRDYLLTYEISDLRKTSAIIRDTSRITLEAPMVYQLKDFDASELKEGEYSLSVTLENKQGKKQAETKTNFKIEWTILSMVLGDYEKAIEQLRYVATSEEHKKLKEAKKDERAKSWADFWKSKDPTPKTERNELFDEYYRRLRYANAHFNIYNKEGWETDMGRIYIIYGHPDEVERHPFERDSKPYQVWYYHKSNRRFLFVDETGYGEYELKYPYDGDYRHH